jgi:hypothetical protein
MREVSVVDVSVLNDMTRTSLAAKVLGDAKERCEMLETEVRSAFDEMIRAIEQNAKCGLTVEVTLADPLHVAWDAYKRGKEQREAVRNDMEARERDRR